MRSGNSWLPGVFFCRLINGQTIMTGTLFALILLGCSDAGDQCARLEAPAATYATRAECERQQEVALMSDVSLKADFPTVTAQCRAQSASTRSPGRQLALRHR